MNNTPKTNAAPAAKTKIKLTKKQIISISVAVAALLVITAVIVVIAAMPRMFKFDKGEIKDSRGITYKMVTDNFRPVSYYTDEHYAILDHPIYGRVPLYLVNGAGDAYLYCKEDNILYRKSNVNLPSIEDLNTSSIMLSNIGDTELSIKETKDDEIIKKYVALISNDENAISDPFIEPLKTYRISFRSEDYPYLMYTLSYYEYSHGLYMIYDRLHDRYYICGDDFHKLLEGSEVEGEETKEGDTEL